MNPNSKAQSLVSRDEVLTIVQKWIDGGLIADPRITLNILALPNAKADDERGDEARDAARYRWLRDNAEPWHKVRSTPYARISVVMRDDDEARKEFWIRGTRDGVGICALDTAVDAAIANQEAQDE